DAVSALFREVPERQLAYQRFSVLRADGRLPGMGPAFFTKLIFFMGQSPRGYILDQWTARSVNLLFCDDPIKLLPGGFVSDANDATAYERFCTRVEQLAPILSEATGQPHCGEEAERAIFSRGGKRAGKWRRYVRQQPLV